MTFAVTKVFVGVCFFVNRLRNQGTGCSWAMGEEREEHDLAQGFAVHECSCCGWYFSCNPLTKAFYRLFLLLLPPQFPWCGPDSYKLFLRLYCSSHVLSSNGNVMISGGEGRKGVKRCRVAQVGVEFSSLQQRRKRTDNFRVCRKSSDCHLPWPRPRGARPRPRQRLPAAVEPRPRSRAPPPPSWLRPLHPAFRSSGIIALFWYYFALGSWFKRVSAATKVFSPWTYIKMLAYFCRAF